MHTLSSLRPISKGAERLVKVIWGLPFFSNPNAIGMAAWSMPQKLQPLGRWKSESPVGPCLPGSSWALRSNASSFGSIGDGSVVSCFGAGDIPGGSRKEGSGLGPWKVLGVRSIPLSPSSLLIVPGSASICQSAHGAKGFYLPTARLELLPSAVRHSWGNTQSSGGGTGIHILCPVLPGP